MKRLLLAAALSVGLVATTHSAVISTIGSENSTINPWGLPDTAAYGQTFNLAAAANLNSVLFRIDDFGTATSYDMMVFAWTGSMASGSSLASLSGSTGGVAGMSNVMSNVGSVALAAGDYIAFLQATSSNAAVWGSINTADAYAGGAFVYQNNTGDTTQWTSNIWNANFEGPGYDLAFEMVFDRGVPVPVPTTIALFGLGLAGLGWSRRKKV